MNKKFKIKICEILLLTAVMAIYGWFFSKYLSMLPAFNDPLIYIEPTARGTLIGYFPLIDRLMIANSVRLFSLIFYHAEIAGAVYFGVVNFLILIIAMVWSYLKKGFWTAFLVGLFLAISYPLLRYANYGYPDATVTLYGLIAFIFYTSKSKKLIYWTGFFTALAFFSKITGLAILCYFIFDLISKKRLRDLKIFFAGVFSSFIAIILLTGLLFDFSSVRYVFAKIGQNITANTEPRSIARSLLNFLRPEVILPGYVALIVFLKAYRDRLIQKIFLFALFFIGFFALLVIFSSHVKIYPHYLYTAAIFATIGMAFYLGSFEGDQKNKINQFRYAILALILTTLGIKFGLKNSNHFIFNNINDLMALPLWLKIVYSAFPLLVLGLMLAVARLRSMTWALIFILAITLASSFFSSASAYSVIKKQKGEITYFYKYAEAFTKTPEDFSVYEVSESPERQQQIALTYFLFYNNDPSLRQIGRLEMTKKINFLEKEEIPNQKGVIVTEDLSAVLAYFPEAKVTKEFRWAGGQISIVKI